MGSEKFTGVPGEDGGDFLRGAWTRRQFLAKAGVAAAAVGVVGGLPTLAACGSSGDTAVEEKAGSAAIVRFVFAPDPVWNQMKDTGVVAKYEDLFNMRIVNTQTWDETAWFVGGHADIASMATYEVPTIEENSGRSFTNFGQYNMMRNTIFVKSDSPYKDIPDLKGKKICVGGTGADQLMWRAMIKKKYGLDLRLGGGDFQCQIQEFMAQPAALDKGSFDASIGLIDYEIPYMVSNTHRFLFPEQPTGWEFYREYFDPEKSHIGVMMNLYVGQQAWVKDNPKVAQAFNEMWQVGVNQYWADKEANIRAYPDLYTVTNDKELKWFLDYLEQHDSCVSTVYMNQKWIDKEKAVFGLLKETGLVKQETPDPEFLVMAPRADCPKDALPPESAT